MLAIFIGIVMLLAISPSQMWSPADNTGRALFARGWWPRLREAVISPSVVTFQAVSLSGSLFPSAVLANNRPLMVFSHMLREVCHSQVIWRVIDRIKIQMMDMFMVIKRPSERLLHYKSMFKNVVSTLVLLGVLRFKDANIALRIQALSTFPNPMSLLRVVVVKFNRAFTAAQSFRWFSAIFTCHPGIVTTIPLRTT